MTKRFKVAVAVAAMMAMTSASAVQAAGPSPCYKIWNLLVLAKKCVP